MTFAPVMTQDPASVDISGSGSNGGTVETIVVKSWNPFPPVFHLHHPAVAQEPVQPADHLNATESSWTH
ncbi:hypothetical protein [Rhodoligotrophos ferricapiens]|uniref:hypothetical protein n=1 Tax=Rhodoligotrophos ferricapiens TaxID=3069264 RepID=UPI00315DE6BB